MKKILVIVVLLVGLLFNAEAIVNVSWQWDYSASSGVFRNDGSTLLPVGSTVQLIFVGANAALDPLNVLNPLVPTGDDVLLDTFILTDAGGWGVGYAPIAGTFGTAGDPEGYVGGILYQRVFDDWNGGGIGDGDYYGDGTFASAAMLNGETVPTPTPTTSALFDSSVTGPYNVDQLIVIPEPSTVLLSLLGLGVIMVRRFRK